MLELDGLQKRYGDVVALDGCSFKVARGRVLGFVGRNGAGKTTAMRGIFGLVALDAGTVRWDGAVVTQESRVDFGYMPEERGLYPRMRIRDQIVFFSQLRGLNAHAAGQEADRWLARLDLADRSSATLESLSHGNQQKIQLAVSLAGDPDLLVLDEPFSGLDPIAAETLSSVIRDEAANGKAIVFSSHQLDLVGDVCDDVAIITNGKVVESGDLEEIRRASPFRYAAATFLEDVAQADVEHAVNGLEGSHIVSCDAREVRLQVHADERVEDVLAVFAGLGRVERFRFEPPNLEDIFREAVRE